MKFIYPITALLFSLTVHAEKIGVSTLPLAEAVENVYPAIVRIEVVSEEGSRGRMMKSRATGSS